MQELKLNGLWYATEPNNLYNFIWGCISYLRSVEELDPTTITMVKAFDFSNLLEENDVTLLSEGLGYKHYGQNMYDRSEEVGVIPISTFEEVSLKGLKEYVRQWLNIFDDLKWYNTELVDIYRTIAEYLQDIIEGNIEVRFEEAKKEG